VPSEVTAVEEGRTVPQAISEITSQMREAVHRHVALLRGECQDVLLVAAVVGPEFTVEVIRSVCERPLEEVRLLLESEVASGILREISRERGIFAFATEGFREVLYEELPPARRRWLHQKVEEAAGEIS
jgi:predicted ATPase